MKFRLNPLLWLIYRLLQALAWTGVMVFYRKRLVLGREHLRFRGPAIVVVNHPSTLMDVLNPGAHIWPVMFFLANYGLFKHPLSNWLLRRLFCIPVKRREDVGAGEDRNNDAAFEASFEHLRRGGTLFIAAEGVSWMNRFVRSLKTGAARIAFGAEARNDWQLGVKIVPIGLSYDAPDKFRSTVVVQAGAPIFARDWAEKYRADANAGVDALTEHLENQLKTLSIHTRDEAGELYLTRLESVLQNEQPLSLRGSFERWQSLVKTALDHGALRQKTNDYFAELAIASPRRPAAWKALEQGLALCNRPNARALAWRDALLLLFGLPFALIGLAFWFLPCYLPWLLAKRLNLYVGYDSNVKLLGGLFTFPLAFWGAWHLAFAYFQNGALAWLTLLVLLALGFHLEAMEQVWARLQSRRTARRLAQEAPAVFEKLVSLRAELLKMGKNLG